MNKIEQKIEAILFIIGDPVSLEKLAGVIQEKIEVIEKTISVLKDKYASESSGIHIIEHDSKIQLVTKPEVSEIVEKFIKTEARENLTPAALETLSLISYLGPITKSSIEYIRGVNSSFTIRNLMIRGLVERYSHPKKTGTYLYRPTFDLIRHIGIEKKEDLPDFNKYQKLKESLENE